MEKVFITGRGIYSPIGKNLLENEASLRSGKSGIVRVPEFEEFKLDSLVGGLVEQKPETTLIDRKQMRFCPPSAVMSTVAVAEALAEANIPLDEVRNHRIALVGGVAGSLNREAYQTCATYVNSDYRMRTVSPYSVPRIMPSSAVANVSLIFGITGESYDISSACASSATAIMLASRLIRTGLYDMVIAGGAEPIDWVQALGFCGCRALSRKYNDTPEIASRPFDVNRDGFVLASGAAYVVLESEKSVNARKVRAISEISGVYGNSNATDMVVPDMHASRDVIAGALADANLSASDIGYVNTHGTATPVGDPVEIGAIRESLGSHVAVNSTKSQTGHMVGATGAAEVIFSSIMLEKKFISRSINLDEVDPACMGVDLVRELREGVNVKHALSNSFAFGGSNVALIISDCGN